MFVIIKRFTGKCCNSTQQLSMATPASAYHAGLNVATPSSPFMAQIQRLEEKLKFAQDTCGGAACGAGGADTAEQQRASFGSASGLNPSAGAIAAEAIEEAADMRMRMAKQLINRSEHQQRENEGLSARVSQLDQSLRASEASRKLDAVRNAEELYSVRNALENERRRSASPNREGAVAGSFTREWQLRAELAEATHEAQLARSQVQASQAEQQRMSAELSSRAASATQGVLKLQDEVRTSLEERQMLVSQLNDSKQLLEGMRHEHAAVLREKTAVAEAIAAASSSADAARYEASEARKQAAAAARAEEEAKDFAERRRVETVAEATRAAAGAVAAVQAQAARTLSHVQESSTQREAELQSAARAAQTAHDSAADSARMWEARALAAELEVGELRRAVATFRQAVFPCTAEQMRSMLEHCFGNELREAERAHKAQALTIGGLTEELTRVRAQLRVAEASGAETARALRCESDVARAEHGAVSLALTEAVQAAEAAVLSEASSAQRALEQARETSEGLLSGERARREAAEAEVSRLTEESEAYRSEVEASRAAMQDAQRAALSAAMTAKRVAVAATQEYDQRVSRESELESQYGKWVSLEAQLRESHAEALVVAEDEKRLRLAAESEARRMEESGVLAAAQAEEERYGKSLALKQLAEARAQLAAEGVNQRSLALEMGDCDVTLAHLAATHATDVENLRGKISSLTEERQCLADEAATAMTLAKEEATRAAAKAAETAAQACEAVLRRELKAEFQAESALQRATDALAASARREEAECRMRAMNAIQAIEFESMEKVMVQVGVNGAVAQRALDTLEASLATENESNAETDLEAELAGEREKSENLIQRLTRERDEARAEALANDARVREAAEAAREEAEAELQQEIQKTQAEAEQAREELAETNAQAELEKDAHMGQLAISAHAIEKLTLEKEALEEKLVNEQEMRQREIAALEGRQADDQEKLQRVEQERAQSLAMAAEEADRLAMELQDERERRDIMEGMHEKETATLKTALHKATGFKDPKVGSGTAAASASSSARKSAAAPGVEPVGPSSPSRMSPTPMTGAAAVGKTGATKAAVKKAVA